MPDWLDEFKNLLRGLLGRDTPGGTGIGVGIGGDSEAGDVISDIVNEIMIADGDTTISPELSNAIGDYIATIGDQTAQVGDVRSGDVNLSDVVGDIEGSTATVGDVNTGDVSSDVNVTTGPQTIDVTTGPVTTDVAAAGGASEAEATGGSNVLGDILTTLSNTFMGDAQTCSMRIMSLWQFSDRESKVFTPERA